MKDVVASGGGSGKRPAEGTGGDTPWARCARREIGWTWGSRRGRREPAVGCKWLQCVVQSGVESRNATSLTASYIEPPPHVHSTQVNTSECAASAGAGLDTASRSASDGRHEPGPGRRLLRGGAFRAPVRLDRPEHLAGVATHRHRARGAHGAGPSLLAQRGGRRPAGQPRHSSFASDGRAHRGRQHA